VVGPDDPVRAHARFRAGATPNARASSPRSRRAWRSWIPCPSLCSPAVGCTVS